jgi:hypothetical protein
MHRPAATRITWIIRGTYAGRIQGRVADCATRGVYDISPFYPARDLGELKALLYENPSMGIKHKPPNPKDEIAPSETLDNQPSDEHISGSPHDLKTLRELAHTIRELNRRITSPADDTDGYPLLYPFKIKIGRGKYKSWWPDIPLVLVIIEDSVVNLLSTYDMRRNPHGLWKKQIKDKPPNRGFPCPYQINSRD